MPEGDQQEQNRWMEQIVAGYRPEIEQARKRYDILNTVYQTGCKVAGDFKPKMRIVFDAFLPQWNYRIIPAQTFI
jgi:hypothetical protein